jgi:hypothetical protein
MILCHKYKFIFLKTNKTAGTSVEIALSKFCGDRDIITPIVEEDEKIRRSLGYTGPQNYILPFSDYSMRDFFNVLFKRRKKKFYNHITAKEIRKLIGDHIWNEYYTFCFERNPWDRVVSLYYWRCKKEPRPTISEFLSSRIPLTLKRRGYDVYTINDKVVVDRVCLFENLNEELEKIRTRVGIPEKLVLPRAKSSYRKDRRHYRDIINDEDRKRIEHMFSKEIQLFGYTF